MNTMKTANTKFKRLAACASLSVLLAYGLALPESWAQSAPDTANVPVLMVPDFTAVVAKTETSVVNIRTTEAVPMRGSRGGPGGSDPYDMFRWFFGPDFMPPGMPNKPERATPAPQQQERTVPRGVGSGFIISSDGYILTNNHVVAKSNGIFVTLTSGKEYPAKIIGTDPRTDVALIKIEATNLPTLPVGDSNRLKKGQWVLAIGSPFGLDSTVTSGIVSAINRETGDYLPFIQTDVAVNPGNSGGPLIDLAGQVVGMNSQIVSQSGGFMGISLAIPIDEVMRVVEQLKAHGKVTRGRIGVQIGVVSEDVAKAIGLEKAQGALVSNIEKDGPAEKSGVRSGDVILSFDGKEIKHMTDLPRIVGSTKPGNKVPMEVWRKGKKITLNTTVVEMPSADGPEATANEGSTPEALPADVLGLQVSAITEAVRSTQQISNGVMVVQAEGPAAAAGLAEGDIIVTINDVDITSPEQYAKVVSGLSSSRAAALLVVRGDQSQWVTVTPNK